MTEDTRRALRDVRPLAEELGIEIGADDKWLYLDNTKIAIGWNSTYATVMEALGYIFLKEYPRFRKFELSEDMVEAIQLYWGK